MSASGRIVKSGAEVLVAGAPLRREVADALERLARLLVPNTHDRLADGRRADPADDRLERIRETIRFLGHIMSGWSGTADDGPPDVGAGLGSSVVVDDIDTGARETYVLMTGALLDIDGGQVSLASPIGQALLGVTGGEVVTVATPQRTRRLRVLSVRTLRDLLDDDLVAAPAATW